MKVAIIHYNWYLQAHGKLLAEGFLSKNASVDMYFFNMKGRFVPYPQGKRINIFTKNIQNRFLFFLNKALHAIYIRIKFIRKFIDKIYDSVLVASLKFFNSNDHYDLIIGVETGGGLIAQHFSQMTRTPYLYYSLELNDNQDHSYELVLGAMARKEPAIVQGAAGVIIQDHCRSEFFFRLNHPNSIVYLPVSVRRTLPRAIPREKVCVAFGNNHFFKENDFLALSRALPPEWKVVLHNVSLPKEKEIVSRLNLSNIIISEGYLDDDSIDKLLSSASIGLAFYGGQDENVRRIIFSSEKVARCLSLGLPIITNQLGNAKLLFSEISCGFAVKNVIDIGCAIKAIDKEYSLYSENAKFAFERYYNFSTNFEKAYIKIIDILSERKS